MGHSIWVKTTIEISDHLLLRAKQLAKEQNTTLRSLTEEGLRMVLDQREKSKKRKIKPVIVNGNGLRPEFANASWAQIRAACYGEYEGFESNPAKKNSKGWKSKAERESDAPMLVREKKRKPRSKKTKS